VLLALPALLAVGLLRHTREFYQLPKGFYGMESIFRPPDLGEIKMTRV
jgi:hypothetical protein